MSSEVLDGKNTFCDDEDGGIYTRLRKRRGTPIYDYDLIDDDVYIKALKDTEKMIFEEYRKEEELHRMMHSKKQKFFEREEKDNDNGNDYGYDDGGDEEGESDYDVVTCVVCDQDSKQTSKKCDNCGHEFRSSKGYVKDGFIASNKLHDDEQSDDDESDSNEEYSEESGVEDTFYNSDSSDDDQGHGDEDEYCCEYSEEEDDGEEHLEQEGEDEDEYDELEYE